DSARDHPQDAHGSGRGRPRFPLHPRRRQGCAGRLRPDPPHLRGRHRREPGEARPAAQAHRALLRGLSDHQVGPAGRVASRPHVRHAGARRARRVGWVKSPARRPQRRQRRGGDFAHAERFRDAPLPTLRRLMSPDLLFVLSLAAKMAVTAAFVVLATSLAERAGAVVGAMIATLPIAAGPAYIFLSLDHAPEFIADSALSSLVVNAANCVFALVYTLLPQRRGLALSVVPSLIA